MMLLILTTLFLTVLLSRPFNIILLLLSTFLVILERKGFVKANDEDIAILIMVFLFLTFLNSGMFSDKIPLVTDFAYFLHKSLALTKGYYNQDFNAGYEEVVESFYPPLLLLLPHFLRPFFGIEFSFRIVHFLCFLFPSISLYVLARYLKIKHTFLPSLLFLAFNHIYFFHGDTGPYLALGFSLLSVLYALKGEHAKMALLCALTLLSHLTVFISTIILNALLLRASQRRWLLLSLLPSAIYLPSVIHFMLDSRCSPFLLSLLNKLQKPLLTLEVAFLRDIFFDSIPILLFGFLSPFYVKKRPIKKIVQASILISELAVAICLVQQLDVFFPLNAVGRGRFFFCVRTFLILPSSLFISKSLSNKKVRSFVLFVLLYSLSLPLLFILRFWADTTDFIFVERFGDTFYSWQGLDLTTGIFRYKPKYSVQKIIEWLVQHRDNRSRVFWEASLGEDYGGGMLFITPIETGMPSVSYWHIFEEDFFENLEKIFTSHNIRYVVIYSDEWREALSNSSSFRQILSFPDGLSLYEFSDAPRSFIQGAKAELIELSDHRMKWLLNTSRAGEVVISFRYSPRWHAFLDGEEVYLRREPEFHFMAVNVEAGEHELELVYQKGMFLTAVELITGASLFFLGVLALWK